VSTQEDAGEEIDIEAELGIELGTGDHGDHEEEEKGWCSTVIGKQVCT
jgi:hypothetical protein